MLFTEYGNKDMPAVLLMHGMLQDWHSMYKALHPLEKNFRLIIPAMDGMYKDSGVFTSFADQCRQIEKFVKENYDGKLLGVYGISQGATLMTELLARNKIDVKYAVLDGLYVAHQGEFSAKCTYNMFTKAQANGGKFPKAMIVMMKLMGLSEDDYKMMDSTAYWDFDLISLERNLTENYTYHINTDISKNKTNVILMRGEKEPYAKKSNRIFKSYRPECKEVVFKDLGHGQMFFNHSGALCSRLKKIFSADRDVYLQAMEKNRSVLIFKELGKYDMVYDGLEEIYGKAAMELITKSAEVHFAECRRLTADAPEGEKKHLNDTIMLTVAFYKALQEYDDTHAYENIRKAMLDMCAQIGERLGQLLHIPYGKDLFMNLAPKILKKSFGRECGFAFKNFKASSEKVSFDMVKCPYCKYTELFGCPELTPVFCDCDNASYGNLSGIRFKRTQTLGSGGEKCDFLFERCDK